MTYQTRPSSDGGFYFLCGDDHPTDEELEGMTWWYGLDDDARAHWMRLAGGTGVAADAWAVFKNEIRTPP